jgi:putative ABC transport system permease protein
VHSSLDPEALSGSARGAVWAVDPNVPVFRVESMEQVLADSISSQRLTAALIGLFGALALALAAIGVFGVLSFTVSQRTNEIGIRMALGAGRSEVLRLVLREGMMLATVGVGLGVLGALALTRLLSGLLFGVGPTDPLTFAAVLALLTSVSFVACYLPGRRAAAVEPMVALRYE